MREITYSQALNEALRDALASNPDVFLMGEDIGRYGGVFGVTRGLLQEFGPERVRDTPISEAAFMGIALGAAATGKVPIVEIMFFDFTLVAADQIINNVAKARYMSGGQVKVPMVIRTQGGGYRGSAAQHSQCLEALFAHCPGLKVVMPATPYDAKGLLKTAIEDPDPVLFIEHKLLYNTKGHVPSESYRIPFAQANVIQEGTDVTIFAFSKMVEVATEAARRLAEEDGLSVELIDPRTLVPFDWETAVRSLQKTNRAVIVHEATEFLGFGAELAARLQEEAFDYLDAPIARVGAKYAPIPYAQVLEYTALPTADDVVAAVRRLFR